MKKRTKKEVRNRLMKLAKNCFHTAFNDGLFKDRKWDRLNHMAKLAFWREFYLYFGVDDILPF